MKNMMYITATFFYIGKFPVGPGTMASLISLPLYFLIINNTVLYLVVLLLVIGIGVISSRSVAIESGDEDPSYVVIDEVAGMGVSLFLAPKSVLYFIIAFILFRLFDIFKLPFIKKAEHIGNGIGIMLDDIIAGVMTMGIMLIIHTVGVI